MGRWDEQLDRSDPQAILSIRYFFSMRLVLNGGVS